MIGDASEAVRILSEVGLWELSGDEGCGCAWCSIVGFDIAVSCGRGDGDANITISGGGPATDEGRRLVAEEVLRQIRERGFRVSPERLPIRLSERRAR